MPKKKRPFPDPLCLHVPEQFSEKQVRKLRKKMGLKMKPFAERFNVTKATISRWESGKSPVEGPAVIVMQTLWAENFC